MDNGGGIKDSSFTGIIRSYNGYNTGGLVGYLNCSTQKCWANAEIDAEDTTNVGGFAGQIVAVVTHITILSQILCPQALCRRFAGRTKAKC